ncbi:GntR family transcriptional regulator [Enterococcus asini]|uniref:GntR family transcriptional regulator n=1 Tax=Enterococcus asini TaxID=57732 RepID=UPI0028914F9B|nr:GntR family transcriptional regulator [Enterococcus asini]MDT2764271.1 GntR family transcriptional regulator [Enterococcus asini]
MAQSTPLYVQLADELRDKIAQGEFVPDSQIPSENELHQTTGYSRSTVRKALAILVEEGRLTKVHGKGTFVTALDNHLVNKQNHHFLSLTENIRKRGQTLTTKVVDLRWVEPTREQTQFFQLTEDAQLLEITRLRILDDFPLCVETDWFTSDFASLESEDLAGSLYGLLREKFDVQPATGKKTFSISYATQQEAFLLDVPRGSALMEIEDYVNDHKGTPLHIARQVLRGDRFKYVVID